MGIGSSPKVVKKNNKKFHCKKTGPVHLVINMNSCEKNCKKDCIFTKITENGKMFDFPK